MKTDLYGDRDTWPIGDAMVENLELYRTELSQTGYARLPLVNRAYFDQLRERRVRAIDLARQLKPTILFVGYLHPNSFGSDQPAKQTLRSSYERAWKVIRRRRATAIILIEESCGALGESPVTIDRYARAMQLIGEEAGLGRPPVSELIARIKQNRTNQLVHTYMLNAPEPFQIFAGEEWPLEAEFEIRTRHSEGGDERETRDDPIFHTVIRLTHLRSEIIVIRAIERLVNMGLQEAIVLQGSYHGHQMPELAALYGFTLEIHGTSI